MSKRVLMILNNHYTHDPRVTAEAESLVQGGYEVKVIAWDRKRKYPSHEIINGVEIIRIRLPKILDKLMPFKILKVPIWQVLAYRKALHLYKKWKFKIVHVHDWPDLPIGAWLKKKLGVRVIYDSHEVWTYLIFTKRLPGWLNEAIWRELSQLRYVDVLITVGREYKMYFVHYFPKIWIVYNSKQRRHKWLKPQVDLLKIVYIGGFNNNRCIHELLNAISEIQYSTVKAVFAGPTAKGFTDAIENISITDPRIEYLGFIPKSQVLNETEDGNVVWFVFRNSDPLYKIGMPNKLFEAIATGRMSLAGKGTASGEFVEMYKIGLALNCDVEEIKKALINFIENPKLIIKFGRRAYSVGSKYNWKKESKKLLEIYNCLLGGDSNDDAG